MKVILYAKNIKDYQEKLKDFNFSYESNYENLKKTIKEYDGLIAFGLKDDIDLSNLKWIQSLGAGVDWAVNNKTINKDVILTRVTTGLNQLLFEYTLARILSYYQNLSTHYQNQKEHIWDRNLSVSVVGKKVLIVGTGQIGSYIGKELNKLKMEVYGINSTGYDLEGFKKCYTFDNLETSKKYDIVVNVLPSTSKTINIFNKELFEKIKMDVFVNVGRGTAVVEEDLAEQLKDEKIKKAFLDVFQTEPLKETSKLWDTPNLVISPHVAAFMDAGNLSDVITTNYQKIIKGEEIEKVNLKKGY